MAVVTSDHAGIVQTYKLFYEECETLQAVYSRDNCANSIIATSTVLNEIMHNFQNDVEEVSFFVSSGWLVTVPKFAKMMVLRQTNSRCPTTWKSMAAATPGYAAFTLISSSESSLTYRGRLRTNLFVDVSEFRQYNITQPSNVTFCLKEFRSILAFCDYVSEVTACFLISSPIECLNTAYARLVRHGRSPDRLQRGRHRFLWRLRSGDNPGKAFF